MKTDVVAIGSNYSTLLGNIKSLGLDGHKCYLVKRGKNKIPTADKKSEYVKDTLQINLYPDENDIALIIEKFADKDNKRVLLPSDDMCSSLLDMFYDKLSEHFILPNINRKQGEITRLMNKSVQKVYAEKSGLKVANAVTIQMSNSEIPQDVKYPCFTKPLQSKGAGKDLIQKIDSSDQLSALLRRAKESGVESVLVEDYVEVTNEFTIPGVAVNGKVFIPAYIRKSLISSGLHRGVTISGSVWNFSKYAELQGKLMEFIRLVGFEGVFDIEVLQSGNDFYFNELNLRNGAAGYALTKAGINLPAYFVSAIYDKDAILDVSKFKEGLSFVSDKAALEAYLDGAFSYKKYKELLASADFCFLTDDVDMPAKRQFFKYKLCYIIWNMIKKC